MTGAADTLQTSASETSSPAGQFLYPCVSTYLRVSFWACLYTAFLSSSLQFIHSLAARLSFGASGEIPKPRDSTVFGTYAKRKIVDFGNELRVVRLSPVAMLPCQEPPLLLGSCNSKNEILVFKTGGVPGVGLPCVPHTHFSNPSRPSTTHRFLALKPF